MKDKDTPMIVMMVKLDNFLAFRDFSLNMSYPKKIVKSYIKDEYLKDSPKFRYKRLIILMGSNATGKTSLGQMFNHIFNFMIRRQTDNLLSSVCDKSRNAHFSIDFIVQDKTAVLYRLEVLIEPLATSKEPVIRAKLREVQIKRQDSYESACSRLEKQEVNYSDYIEVLRRIPLFGFFFSYPMDVLPNTVPKDNSGEYRDILEKVLMVLDSAITHVDIVPEAQNAYNIHMQNGRNVLIQEGQVVDTSILSSGTKAGIGIAHILTAMKGHSCGFYYCDERFSYIQSEIERAILSVMIELLGEGEQLFFTTHNTDILNLSLPKHTYTFMYKRQTEQGSEIRCVNASDYLKRNTDSLKRAFENDTFSVLPDTRLIYGISGAQE